MSDKIKNFLLVASLVVIAVFTVYLVFYAFGVVSKPTTVSTGQHITFDGHALDVDGKSTVTVESAYTVKAWSDVTVTTSIVTVTVWTK